MKNLLPQSRFPTRILIIVPFVIGFILLGIQLVLFKKYTGEIGQEILISLTFFFWGLSGIPMIVRKEAPGFLIKGPLAVAEGWILLLLGWVIAIGIWLI